MHVISWATPGREATDPKVLRIMDHESLMNVIDKDRNLTGFGRELADAVMKAVGRRVTHIHSPHWFQNLEWLDTGKADFSMTRDTPRSEADFWITASLSWKSRKLFLSGRTSMT